MKNVGLVGWRGMVGSVLMERLNADSSFKKFNPHFFSTSQVGRPGPAASEGAPLLDAFSIDELKKMDIIVSCQGGDYTNKIFKQLRLNNWDGYWIDAASTLRMEKDSILVLDPINHDVIEQGISQGKKELIGANCTVSLMLMALGGLFKADLVEWVSSMTYQAASGAGARNMLELIEQMGFLAEESLQMRKDPSKTILEVDQKISESFGNPHFPQSQFGAPLAGSLIPWIDSAMDNGQTREEWKAMAECNKILANENPIPVDGTCVRIGAMRCHSQAFTIKLKKDVPLDECAHLIKESHSWVSLVENNKEQTVRDLSPAKISGTLNIPVGRLRKMNLGNEYLNAFSIGDQLLWGAAEPLKRVLDILLDM